jgi:DNA helicase-2/ATP-dependent DNA helicase PcrA
LRALGGLRADEDRRPDVNRWDAFTREYSSALEMRDAIRNMSLAAVVTETIHAAKGGEWDHVFVVGVTEGYLPMYLSRDELAVTEDRNLLFVAITRAKGTVRLYHAPSDHPRSQRRFTALSPFVDQRAVRKTLQFRNHQ